MDFPANFRQLSQKFEEDKGNEVCTLLEEIVTQSKLLENRWNNFSEKRLLYVYYEIYISRELRISCFYCFPVGYQY